MELATQSPPAGTLTLRPIDLVYWGSVAILFAIVHATQDLLAVGLNALAAMTGVSPTPRVMAVALEYIASLKGMLFLACASVVALPVLRDAGRYLSRMEMSERLHVLLHSIGVAALLACLVFTLGNQSMGNGYAIRSLSPFSQGAGWFNKRLLMPGLAHLFFFRGGWLYYAFGNLACLVFLCVLWSWLKEEAPLKLWQVLSVATCSFVVYQFQYPGYPDVLVFTLFLLVMTASFSQEARVSSLILALLAHESSMFMGVVLACRYLKRPHLLKFAAALAMYNAIWLAAYGFDVNAVLTVHNVAGMSGVTWVLLSPRLEWLGLLVAYKAVWLLVILGVVLAIRRRLTRDAAFIVASVGTGVFMTCIGVDTSRLMGYAFPGLLLSLRTIRHHMTDRLAGQTLSWVLAVNLLIPSFNVGLNVGVVPRPGVYEYLYRGFPHRIATQTSSVFRSWRHPLAEP